MKVVRYNYASHFNESEYAQIFTEIKRINDTGSFILSNEVHEFETLFATYTSADYCVGCNSGTDAIVLALLSLGIGGGDEVLVVANTFYATVDAICISGATPILHDADEKSFLASYDTIESKITRKTKAILVVHLYGSPCDMNEILLLAQKHNLKVIEDCAQAHGARFSGKHVGTFGDVGCFSFHPSKNLPASGDGGACITNNAEIAEKMHILRNLGQKKQNHHETVAFNTRLDSIQAIFLKTRLPKLDAWNLSRIAVANKIKHNMKNLPLFFQQHLPESFPVYHLLTVNAGTYRDRLFSWLNERGIEATIRYPHPIHLQPAFTFLRYAQGDFPIAEKLCDQLLCLPIRPDLSNEEIEYMVETIKVFYNGN